MTKEKTEFVCEIMEQFFDKMCSECPPCYEIVHYCASPPKTSNFIKKLCCKVCFYYKLLSHHCVYCYVFRLHAFVTCTCSMSIRYLCDCHLPIKSNLITYVRTYLLTYLLTELVSQLLKDL